MKERKKEKERKGKKRKKLLGERGVEFEEIFIILVNPSIITVIETEPPLNTNFCF